MFTIKENKISQREITVPQPAIISASWEEMKNQLDEKILHTYVIDKLKIAFRAKIRNQLAKVGDDFVSDEKILEENYIDWIPSFREKVNKVEKTNKMIDNMSHEERENLMKMLKEKGLV